MKAGRACEAEKFFGRFLDKIYQSMAIGHVFRRFLWRTLKNEIFKLLKMKF